MKNALIIANYCAGRKQAVKYRKMIQKFLMHKSVYFKFVTLDELCDVNIDEFDTILIVGGDGTINKVLPSLINSDKTLGIIPTGTANLLAAKLGIFNIKDALFAIENGKTKQIDLIDINKKLCALRCGFGYDSDIICKTPQSFKNKFGYFAYFIAGIIFALKLTPKTYYITYDNKTLSINATCIIIGNACNMYRNITSFANNSELDDGYLDIFILKAKNPITFFYEFLRIIFGIRINNSRAKYFKEKSLKINNTWTACHVDGEKTKLKGDIEIKVMPSAVKVFTK